jgi:glycosyltransferase involved in cell wall biosynthesis
MTKICFINTNKAWGGGEKWHFQTAQELLLKNFSVHFITAQNSALADKLSQTKIPTTILKVNKFSWLNPLLRNKIKNIFLHENFDVIILNLPNDVKMFAGIAHKCRIKKVIYRRGMNHPIKNNWLNRYLYPRYLTHIVANSEDVAMSVAQNIPSLKSKITIIYNGVNCDEIRNPINARTDIIRLGNLARLTLQKGQSDLIEMASILKNHQLKFKIIIAGTGELYEQLQGKIKEAHLEQEIELVGHQKPEDFFDRIDYFVFPSRFEGLSNALLEAMQFQKPIICYDIASNSEVVTNNFNGFLIPAFEVSLMAKKVIELSQNPDLYHQMQMNGQKVLKEKFDRNKMLTKLIELIT